MTQVTPSFLVAERDGEVLGYLHYDSEGAEPELHRIYVDPARKRGGIGSALMRDLHSRLTAGCSYVLLVAEANTAAQAFYERYGLVVERRVEGPNYYTSAMNLEMKSQPPPAPAVVMRFTKVAALSSPVGRCAYGSPGGILLVARERTEVRPA